MSYEQEIGVKMKRPVTDLASMKDVLTPEKKKKRSAHSDDDKSSTEIDHDVRAKKKPKKKHLLPPAISFEPANIKTSLFVKDLRDLVLYIIGDGRGPNWLAIQNRGAIKRLVSVAIPSLFATDFGLKDTSNDDLSRFRPTPIEVPTHGPSRHLEFFRSRVSHIWPVRAPGTNITLHSPFNEFSDVPLSKEEKKAALNASSHKCRVLKPIDCVLGFQQFADNSYPIHPKITGIPIDIGLELEEAWVDTITEETKRVPKVFGLDCEMCETASGKVVTRITLVSQDKQTVYDELIKPDEPITDYLTRFSGITKELLQNVTTTLAEAQQDLLKIITANDILVGHSLENDLNVMKIRHPLVIDTALLYGTQQGISWKPALRNLTHRFLSREIQKGVNGHDSVEDAVACLDLLDLKLKRGLDFGTKQDTQSIADKLARSLQGRKTCAIVDYNTKRWTATPATLVECLTDDDIIKNASKLVPTTNYTWARLMEIHNLRSTDEKKTDEKKAGKQEQEQEPTKTQKVTEEANEKESQSMLEEAAFERLNTHLETLYQSLPRNTAMLIWTGHGNQQEMRRLQAKKRQYQVDYATKKWDEIENSWTDRDNQKLINAASRARAGSAFILLKTDD